MSDKRKIRPQERELIIFLLHKLQLNSSDYPINEEVDEYEGGVMGSIGLGKDGAEYKEDLIQVHYTDIDNTQVVITLTKDTEGQLLDLDFWKIDFSKLLEYPTPDRIIFKQH